METTLQACACQDTDVTPLESVLVIRHCQKSLLIQKTGE